MVNRHVYAPGEEKITARCSQKGEEGLRHRNEHDQKRQPSRGRTDRSTPHHHRSGGEILSLQGLSSATAITGISVDDVFSSATATSSTQQNCQEINYGGPADTQAAISSS